MKIDLGHPTLAHNYAKGTSGSGEVSQINILRGYIYPIDHSGPRIS